MRRIVFVLLACASTATKTTEHRSAFAALEVVEAIYNVINTAVVSGAAGVDAATDTGVHMLNGYADMLLEHADISSRLFEDIELALRMLRTRHDVFRADLDIAIAHARQTAESYFKWLYVNPTTPVSENSWLSYLGVTEPFFQRMLEVAYTTPTGIKHDPSRKRTGPLRTFDTADLLALSLRWMRGTDDAEGLSAQWRVLPGNFGRHRDAAATLLNEVLRAMPEADVYIPSKAVQELYADCLARSDSDVFLSDETFASVKPIGLIDAYPVSVPEFGGRYCQAMFMNVKYGGHCVLNVKAMAPDGTCFFANVNVPGGFSEWTSAQPIVNLLRNKTLFIDGAVLIGDSLYRVKSAADVLLAVPKVREAVSEPTSLSFGGSICTISGLSQPLLRPTMAPLVLQLLLFLLSPLFSSQIDAFYHGDFAMIAECASFAYCRRQVVELGMGEDKSIKSRRFGLLKLPRNANIRKMMCENIVMLNNARTRWGAFPKSPAIAIISRETVFDTLLRSPSATILFPVFVTRAQIRTIFAFICCRHA